MECPSVAEVVCGTGPGNPCEGPGSPASGPGVASRGAAVLRRYRGGRVLRRVRCGECSALALLVAQVLADHHDPPVTADHLALVADLLDARLDLHDPCPTCSGRRCGRG